MRPIIAALLWLLAVPAFAETKPEPIAPPQWYLDDIMNLAADGGRWIADNSAYKSEQEPYEAYGVEWVSGFDGATMSGRLFGLKDGKETANFWEFRQYWRPDLNEAVIEQFGWGDVVGIGSLAADRAAVTHGDVRRRTKPTPNKMNRPAGSAGRFLAVRRGLNGGGLVRRRRF